MLLGSPAASGENVEPSPFSIENSTIPLPVSLRNHVKYHFIPHTYEFHTLHMVGSLSDFNAMGIILMSRENCANYTNDLTIIQSYRKGHSEL